MKRRRLLRGGAVALSLPLVGCGLPTEADVSESFAEQYAIADGTTVDVRNRHGSITVTQVDGDEVVVEATKVSRQGRDALDQVTIEATQVGSSLVVRAVYPEDGLFTGPRVAVEFEVGLPDSAVAGTFETANGNVTVQDVVGDAKLWSANGNVEARDVDGYVSLRTTNGNVTATGTRGVDRARTANGSIDVEVRDLRGPIAVESSNGSVTMRAVPELQATFELRTDSGTISVQGLALERTTDEPRHVIGDLNGGGERVTAITNNGSVTLRALS